MLAITINGQLIDEYLSKYSVQIVPQIGESFTAVSGKTHSSVTGYKRSLSVDFEPMYTEQMTTLFGAILSGADVSIKYIDPQNGEETRTFSQPTLPAASYEEMETTQGTWLQFWTIPTITFEEKDAESASDDSG